MLVSFVKGYPTLLINREKTLVVGDLHVGLHLKLGESGVHFQKATERMADSLLDAYRRARARDLVLLGDVKESIGSPRFAEYRELKLFFDRLKGIDIRVVKGNHDGGLEKVLKNIGVAADIKREFIVGGVALSHGNAWPSQDAMRCRCLVVGHGHYAIDRNGANEKAWLVARVTAKARRSYARYNRSARLICVPAFNSLATGIKLSGRTLGMLPLFKSGCFDFWSSKVYDINAASCGKAADFAGG